MATIMLATTSSGNPRLPVPRAGIATEDALSRLHSLNSGFNTFFDVSVATHVTAPDVG